MLFIYSRRRRTVLNIIIRNTDPAPIYEQIYTQIKKAVVSGELHEGDMLPSIRALAKDLRISVITTKRAYDELEKEGYINTVAAKGCYVAEKNTALIREEHLRQIEDAMRKILALAAAGGITENELTELYTTIKEEDA